MSLRIRGQEAQLRITVDGAEKNGSFVKVKDFSLTPRTDLMEESYLGEVFDDLDVQHHGYDFTFSVDNEDPQTIQFMEVLQDNEASNINPQRVGLSVEYTYRKVSETPTIQVFTNVVMKVSEHSAGGRKEYISTTFEGKAKEMIVVQF